MIGLLQAPGELNHSLLLAAIAVQHAISVVMKLGVMPVVAGY